MSRLITLFLRDFQAETILDALRGLRLTFLNRGLNTDGIDELIRMVQKEIAASKFLNDQ
jgi:hypothetical protein